MPDLKDVATNQMQDVFEDKALFIWQPRIEISVVYVFCKRIYYKRSYLERADNNPNALEIIRKWLLPTREFGRQSAG